jgi:hypothetical protein
MFYTPRTSRLKELRRIIVENTLDILGAFAVILMYRIESCDIMLRGFEIWRCVQDALNNLVGMKKRKTVVLRSSVVPF